MYDNLSFNSMYYMATQALLNIALDALSTPGVALKTLEHSQLVPQYLGVAIKSHKYYAALTKRS